MKFKDIESVWDALALINGNAFVLPDETEVIMTDDMITIKQPDDDEAFEYTVQDGQVYINGDSRW